MGLYRNLNEICDLLWDLKERYKVLYLICRDGEELRSDEINTIVQSTFRFYIEGLDELNRIDIELDEGAYSLLSKGEQESIHDQIALYLDCAGYISDLTNDFKEAIEKQDADEATDQSEIIQCRYRFCEYGIELVGYCENLIYELSEMQQKIRSRASRRKN